MDKIRIGIVGYGNIGKAVEKAIGQNADMEIPVHAKGAKLCNKL